MTLNESGVPPTPARSVPVVWFVVGILVAAGVGVGATALVLGLPAKSTPGPLSVIDDLGRNVTVPYDPSRVAVFGPSIMDSMFRLGLRSHVVAVDCYAPAFGGLLADYSPQQVAEWNLSSSMCVEVGPEFDFESLLNATPQLVLASTIVSVAAVETISSTYHIPVVMLQPPTMSGILVDESLLGRIFGVQSQAATLNNALTTELANLTNATSNLYSFPTVLVTYDSDENGYWTFGPTTFGQSLIELAGGSSISANSTSAYPELSGEQVLVSNVSLIVYGTGFGLNLSNTYALGPLWSSFPAVQSNQVFPLDSTLITEPDPTMILVGLPTLFAIFHPSA